MAEKRKTIRLRYYKGRTYYSTLTGQYYADYESAFHASKKEGGGVYVDFNLWVVHADGSSEIVY